MGEFESGAPSSRKRKKAAETETPEDVPEKKAKTFCCRTFRQELKGSEALKRLKRFISAAKASDDVIFEYLENGGSLQEILSLIDATATGDLTTALPVFEAVHLILLRFQSSDSKHHERCIESARTILRSHLFIIKAMLSMNVTKQKKAALKVLTAIATLDSSFANEIMNVVALSPTLITDLIQTSPEKESVRKCFILFVLSFLIEGNLTVVKNLLDKKGFLSSIIPGLKFDEASTVNLTLSLFEDKILKNVKIPKTLKLKVFNTQIIKSLFDLYEWKGLQGVKQFTPKKKNKVKEININQSEKEVVTESVHSFLLLLCCSQKYGVAFYDKSLGTSEQLNNQLLLTVFESLPDPLKNKKMAEVILKTTASCPDLMRPLLLKLEPFFQPRNSKNWFQAMDFAENLIKAVDATTMLKTETEPLNGNQIVRVGKALCAPVVFLRIAKLGSQKSQPMEIRFRSLRLLTVIWAEIERLLANFQNFEGDLKKYLQKHISKSLPDAEELVELWHSLCDAEYFSSVPLSQEKKVLFLSAVVDSLHVIVECQSEAVSSPLGLTSDLLNCVEGIKESMSRQEFDDIQVKIVRFVEIDLHGLTPKMELFEKSLLILLRSADDSSLSYLSKLLSSLEIFEGNKTEVEVWVLSYATLPQEYRGAVADFLIESIRRFFDRQKADGKLVYVSRELGVTRRLQLDFLYHFALLLVTPEEIMDGWLEGKEIEGRQPAQSNVELIDDCTNSEIESETPKAPEESPTPLLFNYIESLKAYSPTPSKKDQISIALRHYLNDVVIHLQHFYTVDVYLHDYLKDTKLLPKSTLNYLKNWKNHSVKSVACDIFPSSAEQHLISWLSDDSNESQSIGDVVNVESTNLLTLYSLFRTVVAYLSVKTVAGDLSGVDVEKFAEVLTAFVGFGHADDRDDVDLISHDVKNRTVYQRHCLECLFGNRYLLRGFDVFQKKENCIHQSTAIVFKVLMEGEIIRSCSLKRRLSEPWKCTFLKQLKAKLKKRKSIDGLDKLERVLNFFEYDHDDVKEMVELLSVSELDLFVSGSEPSAWIGILSKFIKMHCHKEELDEAVVKKLCLIIKYLRERCGSNLERMTECFVYLLRKHPSHLLMIENDFLDVILLSTDTTPTTILLGKLLLNDPAKVQYFLQFLTENLNGFDKPQIVFALLSSLIVGENSFLDSCKERSVWKMSEISPGTTSELYKVLELVYKKFEKYIIQELAGESGVLGSVGFARELIKLFLDDKKASKIKKEVAKGKFDPELVFEAVRKLNDGAMTECFVRGLLTLFSRIITKENDLEEGNWLKYCSVVSDVMELGKELSWGNVTGSAEWKEFTKSALGYCLSSSKHPSLLRVLQLMFTTFYKPKQETKDCGLFFQMTISHSQFLKVMLSRSPLKSELVELFHCLIERSPSEMSSKHIPILLASYTASLTACDKTILKILKLYEKNGVGVSDYEPFVWGETAVSHYSIGTSSGLSLWQRFNMGNVLDLLDGQRLELSLKEFPTKRSLDVDDSVVDSNVYDPAFLLPLFVNLLSPGSVVFCLSFIYKGGLAYTVRALSSECKDIRLIASVVLTRFYNHLEMSQNLKQKLVWMHYINCFRYGIEDLSGEPLPNITTLFFARMTLELSRQPAELYIPLQNFLLAKHYFAFDTVPEFLPLFHSSEVSYWKHREWLLEVIRDGTKSAADIQIIFHSMAPKVIFCFFHSQLCDNETKKLILQVVERMLRINKSILLISEYGLLNWIASIESNQAILHDLLNLLSTLTGVIVRDIQHHNSRHSNSSHLIQILNMAVRLLPSLKSVKSAESFQIYLRTINKCFQLFIKEGKSDWFKLNKNRLSDFVDAGVAIMGEEYDCGKFGKLPFYFREFDEEFGCEDLKDCVFLFSMLANERNKNK